MAAGTNRYGTAAMLVDGGGHPRTTCCWFFTRARSSVRKRIDKMTRAPPHGLHTITILYKHTGPTRFGRAFYNVNVTHRYYTERERKINCTSRRVPCLAWYKDNGYIIHKKNFGRRVVRPSTGTVVPENFADPMVVHGKFSIFIYLCIRFMFNSIGPHARQWKQLL